MKMPQTPEDPEQLWGLRRLLTQRTGPGVDVSDFRRRLALGGDQGETQRELQVQLALGALPCNDTPTVPAGSRPSPETAPPTPAPPADGTAAGCSAATTDRRPLG